MIILATAWTGPLDAAADVVLSESMSRTMMTFLTLRIFDAAIYAAQSAQAIPFIGVVISVAARSLEPLNALLGQFSTLMFASTLILGTIKLFLAISSHWIASSLVTAIVVLIMGYFALRIAIPRWVYATTIIVILIRFAVPVVMVSSDVIFQQFLSDEYSKTQEAFHSVAISADSIKDFFTLNGEDKTVSLSSLMDKASQARAGVAQWLGKFPSLIDSATKYTISLSIIFLLQTVVIPFGILVILIQIARALFGFACKTDPADRLIQMTRKIVLHEQEQQSKAKENMQKTKVA